MPPGGARDNAGQSERGAASRRRGRALRATSHVAAACTCRTPALSSSRSQPTGSGGLEHARVRDALAANPSASPDTLRALATDAEVRVRRNVAWNPNTPTATLAVLASEECFNVPTSQLGRPDTRGAEIAAVHRPRRRSARRVTAAPGRGAAGFAAGAGVALVKPTQYKSAREAGALVRDA